MSENVEFLKYRRILQEWGYELVRTRETTYIRRRPFTRDSPTPAQQRARTIMTIVGSSNRGTEGFDQQGLPLVCSRNADGIRTLTAEVKAAAVERRVALARQIADEIGLESVEKAELVRLIRGSA